MSFRVVGIGEVLWDLLPEGKQPGGAPANFAYHACALGANARVISRVGRDQPGLDLLDRLQKLGLPIDTIEIDPEAPTGTVSVTLDRTGQPSYLIHEAVAWDNLVGETPGRVAVVTADAICFGTLAQRFEPSRSTIRSLVQATPPNALRILDVNLRQRYYSADLIRESLALANVLKVNDAELPELARMFSLSGNENSQITELAERSNLHVVALTRGGRGSLLFQAGRWSDHPGVATKVLDTIGAGDSFTAAMAIGLLLRWDLDKVNENANRVAAFVASSAGATPPLPASLKSLFI